MKYFTAIKVSRVKLYNSNEMCNYRFSQRKTVTWKQTFPLGPGKHINWEH